MATTSNDGKILLWDVNLESSTAGQILGDLTHATAEVSPQARRVREALWGEDDTALLSYGADGNARLWRWDNDNAEFVEAFTMSHSSSVASAKWIEEGGRIMTTSAEGIRFWNVVDGGLLRDLPVGKVLWVDTVQMQALAISDGMAPILWDLDNHSELRKFVGHTAAVTGALVDAERDRMIIYDQTTVWLRNFASGDALAALSRGDIKIAKVEWNPSRSRIVIGWEDGTVRQYYWDMDELLRTACRLNTKMDDEIQSLCSDISQPASE